MWLDDSWCFWMTLFVGWSFVAEFFRGSGGSSFIFSESSDLLMLPKSYGHVTFLNLELLFC